MVGSKNDLMLKRRFALQIQFNDLIRDVASEYQYGIKLLLLTDNGILTPNILTHRRVHSGSIFVHINANTEVRNLNVAETKLFTAYYLKDLADKDLIKWFLPGYMRLTFDLAQKRLIHNNSTQGTLNNNSYKRFFERFQLNFLT